MHGAKNASRPFQLQNALQQAQNARELAQAAEKEGQTATAKVLFTSAKINPGKAVEIAKAKQDALTG